MQKTISIKIMEMAAAKKVGIGFGHTDFKELPPLAKKARELGVRATLDHPLLELNVFSDYCLSRPKWGSLELPVTRILSSVPAPCFEKNGSMGLRSHRFHPVIVSETLACNLKDP